MNGNSVPYTEYYWELMSTRVNEDSPTTDDQANINLALDRIRTRSVAISWLFSVFDIAL